MAFTLYKDDPRDPPKREVSFDDLENKAFWCKLGEEKEKAFVKLMRGKIESDYAVQIHPEKGVNAYHPDLLLEYKGQEYIAEVKIKNSPLFFGKRYNVDPQFALTMDLKDSFNYDRLLNQGIDLFIFAWVKWEAHEMTTSYNGRENFYRVKPMRGVWVTRFSKIRALEKSNNPPGIHWYKEKFRHPPSYDLRADLDTETKKWCDEVLAFEPRLKEGEHVKNITSKGFMTNEGRQYTAGQSSGSYVFDLSDETLFEKVYFKMA